MFVYAYGVFTHSHTLCAHTTHIYIYISTHKHTYTKIYCCFTYLELYKNGIIVSPRTCFSYTMLLKFNHVVHKAVNSFIVTGAEHSIVQLYHSLFIHAPTGGHLDFFYVLLSQSVAMNVLYSFFGEYN